MDEITRHWTKSVIICIIISFLTGVIITGTITDAVWLNKSRGQLDTVREQLSDATDTNTRLEQQLERCRDITADLKETIGRDINTIRGAVEIVEEIRYEIACLEYNLGMYDPDSLYKWYDNRVSVKEGE